MPREFIAYAIVVLPPTGFPVQLAVTPIANVGVVRTVRFALVRLRTLPRLHGPVTVADVRVVHPATVLAGTGTVREQRVQFFTSINYSYYLQSYKGNYIQ